MLSHSYMFYICIGCIVVEKKNSYEINLLHLNVTLSGVNCSKFLSLLFDSEGCE